MQSMGDCAFLRFLLDLGVFDAEFDLALFSLCAELPLPVLSF